MNSAYLGSPKQDLETPALCLDEAIYRRNIARILDFLRPRGIGWRPHMKGQKCPQLAKIAVEAGAIGVTCATVYEAEAMVAAGIPDILIAHQTVGANKLRRLAALQRRSRVISACDSAEHLEMLSQAAQQEGVTIPVILELNIGMGRSGIDPQDAAVRLAQRALVTPGIRFLGVMGWEGHALGLDDPAARDAAIDQSIRILLDAVALCRRNGIPIEIVSSSGSGTFQKAGLHQGITEFQAGGASFCDLSYQRWGVPFDFALTILTRVVSRPSPTRIITDAGWKAASKDHGPPLAIGLSLRSVALSAEHGTLELAEPSDTPRVGDPIEFVPSYTDSTVCLHDELCVFRDGVLAEVWPIPGRSGRL